LGKGALFRLGFPESAPTPRWEAPRELVNPEHFDGLRVAAHRCFHEALEAFRPCLKW